MVAKGYGELAEKILRLAFDNDVKVCSDPDLAQILSVVEVDCEIPVEALAAVAEILTYVYRLNGVDSAASVRGAGLRACVYDRRWQRRHDRTRDLPDRDATCGQEQASRRFASGSRSDQDHLDGLQVTVSSGSGVDGADCWSLRPCARPATGRR